MKKLIKIILIILVICAVIIAAAGIAIYRIAISSDGNRDFIFSAEENQVNFEIEDKSIEFKQVNPEYEQADITSYDGLKLNGYMIRQNSDVWVIALHGYDDSGKSMSQLIGGFYSKGYNILLPDMRGHGKSEGSYIGMGWHDRLDVISWIEYLNKEYDSPQIIIYGVSMGGATAMMVSGEKLPSNVKCIIEDCGYSSVKEELTYQSKTLIHMPYFPFVWSADVATKICAGYSFSEASALEQVKKSQTPTLFIHGDADTFVPVENAYEVYEAATCEKQLLIVPGAQHASSMFKDYRLYWNTVYDFVDKYLD